MAAKQDPIAVYEVDADKKDNITRYQLEKMFRLIKEEMKKNGKLKISIEKAQMFYDDNYIPSPLNDRLNEIEPIATFISKKMVLLKRTLNTSNDLDEKIDTIAGLIMCKSSISLLSLAYLTENRSLIEQAKNIYRGL